MANLLPVAFHGDTLYLVELDGEPFTPARPICDAIGVSWSGQHSKLTSAAHRWGCADICIPTLGGEQQTLCIPVRKLSGWLANISAARQQLECASGILAGIEFARDSQARLDLLTAAHSQCQVASLFIANHYDEVRNHG